MDRSLRIGPRGLAPPENLSQPDGAGWEWSLEPMGCQSAPEPSIRFMDVSGYNYTESVSISRPAADLYAIVCDVGRCGELSPVCESGAWDDGAHAGEVGAWFTGHNAIGDISWDTRCQVVAARPGREFAFVNFGPNGDLALVRWGYTFEEEPDGTRVTESWQVLPAYPDFVSGGDETFDVRARIDGMAQMAEDGIKTTLANLKRLAEP